MGIDSKTVKTSISYDQHEIIKDILDLYVPEGVFDLDPTYSKGQFYNHDDLLQPKMKFDLIVQRDGVQEGDCRNLPLESSSVNSIMFDPPFVINGINKEVTDYKHGSCIIGKRFSGFRSPTEMLEFYRDSLKEFYRILAPNGVLVFKCQDTVSSSNNYMSHIYVERMANKFGFYCKDLFVLLAKHRMCGRMVTQQHARKYHSYFYVFIKDDKKKKKVDTIFNTVLNSILNSKV